MNGPDAFTVTYQGGRYGAARDVTFTKLPDNGGYLFKCLGAYCSAKHHDHWIETTSGNYHALDTSNPCGVTVNGGPGLSRSLGCSCREHGCDFHVFVNAGQMVDA